MKSEFTFSPSQIIEIYSQFCFYFYIEINVISLLKINRKKLRGIEIYIPWDCRKCLLVTLKKKRIVSTLLKYSYDCAPLIAFPFQKAFSSIVLALTFLFISLWHAFIRFLSVVAVSYFRMCLFHIIKGPQKTSL